MSQITRPDQDISTGSWSETPLYPKLNGALPGGSKVTSGADPAGDSFEVKLANLAQTCCAGSTLSVALRKTEADSLPTSIALLQGDMVIASQEVEPSQSYGSVDLTLTPDQVCNITDPTDLSVRISAGRPQVACCANIPALLTATIHGVSNCPVLEGVELTLCWNSVRSAWRGQTSVCGIPLWLELNCFGMGPTAFSLVGQWGPGPNPICSVGIATSQKPSPTCDPLFIGFTFHNLSVSAFCPCCASALISGDIDVTA